MVMGALVLFTNVCAGMVVVLPPVATPVTPAGAVTVQLIVVPGVALLRVTAVEALPEQIVWSLCEKLTDGAGFTVMVKLWVVPKHPFISGVTVMVAVTGEVPVFVALNDAIFPVPLVGSPMEASVFTQLNMVLLTVPVKLMAGVLSPLHRVSLVIGSTVGVGSTVTSTVKVAPVHPFDTGVTV